MLTGPAFMKFAYNVIYPLFRCAKKLNHNILYMSSKKINIFKVCDFNDVLR
jgi:hypothetical protein